ncbi:MAG: hypothetical protein LBS81_03815 [Endomicrobium sp.]|jgi:superfamily I DNA and/or RNA helicase|nr:hypothetical protein [Endomicrobium sp.]
MEDGYKKLGKGTGKSAPQRRRELQAVTQKAKNSISVWIMPLDKISNVLPSEISSFDVVIVDEASQSDIRAFLALIRGEKIIIVGNPGQISLLSIGTDESQVQNKIKEYLIGIPCGKYYDLKISIYDIAKMSLGSSSELMLKEHFRCLPEIIHFDSDLCYDGKIIPLRYESPHKKLNPVLETIYLSEGIRDEKLKK